MSEQRKTDVFIAKQSEEIVIESTKPWQISQIWHQARPMVRIGLMSSSSIAQTGTML